MLIAHKTSVRSMHNRGGNFNNKSKDEPTVYLYGDIGGWFGIDHLEFIKDFNKIDADVIHLRVDSGGGDIFAARAIKTCIQQHKAKVIAHVDGLAASAASFLIMGANEVEIVDGGFLMTHKALSGMDILGYFNIDDLRDLITDINKEIDLHVQINQAIANDYAKKTKKPCAECLEWMNNDTWFNAQAALAAGLVDRVYDGEVVKGNYDLSIYNNVPDSLKRDDNQALNKRAAEKALRDAGFEDKDAKTIISKGFQGLRRDVDPPVANPPVDPPVTPVVDQLPVEPKRDVEVPVEEKPAKRDRIADLLCRAEMIAPSI